MRPYEVARFYCKCPRCGVVPGQRCITVADGQFSGWPRSNHPERNRLWRERQAKAKSA